MTFVANPTTLKNRSGLFSQMLPFVALLGYAFAACLAFHEMIRQFGVIVPGGVDACLFQWNLWWGHIGVWTPGQELFWTDYQSYPIGAPLSLFPLNLAQVVWTSLFYEALGPHRTHALTILICFTLTGFFTFLLGRWLDFDFAPSFLAGLIFSFSPLHFANTAGGRVELTFQWVPLCLLFLLRWIETRTWPSALGLWVSFVLLFYSNWYLTLYTLILGACWAAVLLRRQPKMLRLKSFWVQLTVIALLSSIAVAPLVIAAAKVASDTMMHSGHILFSADVLGLLIPGEFSIWGGWTRGIWQDFIGLPEENGVFLGYVTLVLAFLGLRQGPLERQFKILCLLLVAVGILLALGPYLKIGGVYEVRLESLGPLEAPARKAASLFRSLYPSWSISPDHAALPLPYLLLKEAPYFSFSRVPSRFLLLTYLSLALLAGSGLMALTRRSSRAGAVVWSAVLVALVCIEFFPQMQYRSLEVHPFIHQLSQDPDDFPLIDLSPTMAERLLNQAKHGKAIVGGIGETRFTPVVDHYRETGYDSLLEGSVRDLERALFSAREEGIRYILLPSARQYLTGPLLNLCGRLVHSDDQLDVIRIDSDNCSSAVLFQPAR